jgi:hypothetical protein
MLAANALIVQHVHGHRAHADSAQHGGDEAEGCLGIEVTGEDKLYNTWA